MTYHRQKTFENHESNKGACDSDSHAHVAMMTHRLRHDVATP